MSLSTSILSPDRFALSSVARALSSVSAVRADIDMIKTVIRNLISNAIKFSNEGSEVVVSLAEEDGMAIVSVKDSGCGIDDEKSEEVAAYRYSFQYLWYKQ